jgi:hypothetical protein
VNEVRKWCKKGKPPQAPTLNHATPVLNVAVHHTSLSNTNTTRLSKLSFTHRKPYFQLAHINTTLGCDVSSRPIAFLGTTTPTPIIPPQLTHTPTPTPTPKTQPQLRPRHQPPPRALPRHNRTFSANLCFTPRLNLDPTASCGPSLKRKKSCTLLSGTLLPIAYYDISVDRLRDIVYYNPIVEQKRNDDGTIKYRVCGTTGGNLLDVPYVYGLPVST